MKKLCGFIVWLVLIFHIAGKHSLAASASSMKANGEAEAKGFIFETSHEAIVGKAKKEGRLRALISLDAKTIGSLVKLFREKYPFLEMDVQEIAGREAGQRLLLELRTGRANWDVARLAIETYTAHLKHSKKVDLLGMAEQGVLQIPAKMIDPKNRNVVATTSHIGTSAFNRCIMDPSQAPDSWEDFLKPEFKGRKFAVDIRPLNYIPMVAGAGEEQAVKYAKGLAAQQPIWVRGHSRSLVAMAAGEIALHSMTNYNSAMEAMGKDPRGCLQVRLIEPIPVRLSGPQMVVENATNPYAAILWLEFIASPAAQDIIDQDEPLKSSIYSPDSAVEKVVRGKKTWVQEWDDFEKSDRWVQMIVEAFGFPKAEKTKRK
ncbi:MAG: ABC transporter substrate-binding protein [Candidatus Binatia bacterium]